MTDHDVRCLLQHTEVEVQEKSEASQQPGGSAPRRPYPPVGQHTGGLPLSTCLSHIQSESTCEAKPSFHLDSVEIQSKAQISASTQHEVRTVTVGSSEVLEIVLWWFGLYLRWLTTSDLCPSFRRSGSTSSLMSRDAKSISCWFVCFSLLNPSPPTVVDNSRVWIGNILDHFGATAGSGESSANELVRNKEQTGQVKCHILNV